MRLSRRLPIGAEPMSKGGVHFRVWAPSCQTVKVIFWEGAEASQSRLFLTPEEGGYYSVFCPNAQAGCLYYFHLNDNDYPYPDPASRYQPEGPHGPSMVIDPSLFSWTDQQWKGARLEGQVVYEMHIGTFTPEGTWRAAAKELPALASLGVTLLEVMPVADFPGRFGWGYDGVDLFAPCRLYGTPDDLRHFINEAHRLGLGVILDVVYNHLGPDGNYLPSFSKYYLTNRYENEWGDALNFDGENARGVREFFVSNAQYWIDEFHFDGLRLDATQQIFDASKTHILTEIGQRAREAAKGRDTIIVSENETQKTRLVRPVEEGGYGLDGLWNDDFHHSAIVALIGQNAAYYSDHFGKPQELLSALKWGYLFQGQRYKWQNQPRGTPSLDLPPAAFINCIENHDQVSNFVHGKRLHQLTTPGRYRAMSALLLLAPSTPMLFQGQEFCASSPFVYFADHKPDLAKLVQEGRAKFLSQFPAFATILPDAMLSPHDEKTFLRCKLNLKEREENQEIYQMHRDLLRLRREDPVLKQQRRRGIDGAILGEEAFLLRFLSDNGDDRLLLFNLGRALSFYPAPEPLLAPPEGKRWQLLWSSEDPSYGGSGTPTIDTEEGWKILGHAAVLMRPAPREGAP